MFALLVGIVLGVFGKLLYDMFRDQDIPEGAADVQRRAASLLEEARQILQEVRQEIAAAAVTARVSATDKVDRLRDAAAALPGTGEAATAMQPAGRAPAEPTGGPPPETSSDATLRMDEGAGAAPAESPARRRRR